MMHHNIHLMLSAICSNFATTPHNMHFSPCCHSYWKMWLNDIEWKLKYISEPNSHFALNTSCGFIIRMTSATDNPMCPFKSQNPNYFYSSPTTFLALLT